MTLRLKLTYAMGNLGIATITVMHMLYLVYFFFPPKDAGIPYLIPQTGFFMGLTILGLIMSFSRVIDAFFDPLIASFSDRLKHPLGKRIPLMRIVALPFAVSYALVFFVPVSDGVSHLNVIWLFSFMLIGAFFFTAYMIPFYSLMVEIAKTSHEKVDLGTISSAFWFVGFLLVSFTPALWDVFAELFSVSKVWGIRITFCIVAALGFIFMMIPALLIDERKFHNPSIKRTENKILPALRRVLKNRNFRFFLFANIGYTVATVIFESGLIYFITVLALMEAGVQGPLTTVIGVLTLACYPLINRLAKKHGKSFVLKISLFLFAVTFSVISVLGWGDITPWVLMGLVVILSPFAQASFGILPHVITSDCAAYHQYKTGEDSSGMYIATNGFFVKLGSSIGMILFTSFLLFGKDIGSDMGIRYATLFAAIVSVIGLILLSQYNEKEILTYTKGEVQSERRGIE